MLIFKFLEDISPFLVLLVQLMSVQGFRARVDNCLHASLPAYNGFLRFTSDVTTFDLLRASIAAEPLIHILFQAVGLELVIRYVTQCGL